MPVRNYVRPSTYRDSVTLMRLSRDLEALPGIARAAVMMGSPANRDLLREAGLLAGDGERAGPPDLVVAVLADTERDAERARATVEAALAARAPAVRGSEPRPRTLGAALRARPETSLALVSVPGTWAGAEALKALRAGLHVMVFSDNVPVETEIALKREAAARGLFVMGPDCGTAILGGVPLGFANVVPRGRIGLAGASGTGLQEVTSLIAGTGEGVSHAIGLGGRDLSDEVGGAALWRALEALGDDRATEVVCVVGKPPGAAVARRLGEALARVGKPCVVHFTGGARVDATAAHVAATLEDTALAAVALARGDTPAPAEFAAPEAEIAHLVSRASAPLGAAQRYVRGVFAGGTLAGEAVTLLAAALPDVAPGVGGTGAGHRVVDLGDDRFTRGRPHPMIDGAVRREWMEREGRDAATAVLLLDVVLGHGAHPDPVGDILPAIDAVRRARPLVVVASVCGTEADPQRRGAQVAALARAGVLVMPSNAQAARLAARIAAGR